jgi:pimeloyl-ACP methyl ester carboxylesterase
MTESIFFKKQGTGPALILIHGFPMNHHVWDAIVPELQHDFTVYTPDLPGFGKSKLLPGQFSIDDVAAILNQWVTAQGLQQAVVIGHSLGGYVVLAMLKQKPDWFKGFGLLHSTGLEDNAEKKESRTKVLTFIEENGVLAFTSNFIQPLFVNAAHPDISGVRAITIQSAKEAVEGYTRAMRDRPDNTAVIAGASQPVLIIGGMEDKGIPFSSLQEQARLSARVELHLLPDVAHMGMFENKEEVIRIIRAFPKTIAQ